MVNFYKFTIGVEVIHDPPCRHSFQLSPLGPMPPSWHSRPLLVRSAPSRWSSWFKFLARGMIFFKQEFPFPYRMTIFVLSFDPKIRASDLNIQYVSMFSLSFRYLNIFLVAFTIPVWSCSPLVCLNISASSAESCA